jgi:hypothetical protein
MEDRDLKAENSLDSTLGGGLKLHRGINRIALDRQEG